MTSHQNFIERAYYIPSIDRIILFEQNRHHLKVYNPQTIYKETEYNLQSTILSAEYIPDFYAYVCSLKDKKLAFIDIKAPSEDKRIFSFMVPEYVLSIVYVPKYRILFTGGMFGILAAWNIGKIFSSESKERIYKTLNDSQNYTHFLMEGFPVFQNVSINHMIYIPTEDSIATACSDCIIRLYNLRFILDCVGNKLLLPMMKLEGHSKAVRQLTFATPFKLMVSCSFEFELRVWNPKYEDTIEVLKGHDSPLVTVKYADNTYNVVSADVKGVIKVT